MNRTLRRGVSGLALAACFASAFMSVGTWAKDPAPATAPAVPDEGGVPPDVGGQAGKEGASVSDAQVVESMKRGIDFLLSQEKVDNWEIPDETWNGGNKGGVTAIAVYALLHAGDSLQDDNEYHAKLNWRSPAMLPAVQWLSKNMPKATYTAGLEASALTLVPRRPDEKPDEGTMPALQGCKWYLLGAMGGDGGYTYKAPPSTFAGAWNSYYQGGKTAGEKKKLDLAAEQAYKSFGGPLLKLQKMAYDLQEKQKAVTDPAQRAQIADELGAMDAYAHELAPAGDTAKKLADEKQKLANDLQRLNNPNAPAKGGAKGKKKKAPLTKDELEARIEEEKNKIAKLEDDTKAPFTPLGDLSNGQYGTLGAWALADYDPPIEFPDQYWVVQDRFWRLMQNPDGGWPYAHNRHTSQTMTLAGIASLYITQEFVDTDLRLVPKPDKVLASGLAWLEANFKPTNNLYYMYGVERVGLNSGLKFFGTKDWYKEGAAVLLRTQAGDGSWSFHDRVVGTSYGLLFLSRGRNPVAFNKLQYNNPCWDARPRDDAYITRWMSKRFEKPINWQVVNLNVSPDQWMDAPVLLITGSQDPRFTKEDLAKLRSYINAGGMIFSSADGNSLGFTTAMKKYAVEVMDDKYEMRRLPKSHFLFSEEMGIDMPNPPPILGMSNGVREVWIHSQTDIGADWQMRRYASKNSFELGAALYFYASGMGSLKSKLQPLLVANSTAPVAHTVNLARLDYAGNADPEPGAWARMIKLARADGHTQVNVSFVKIADLDAKKYNLADLTGTARVTFNADDVAALRKYLKDGGLLFMDSAGGNTAFADSCSDLMKQIYPNNPATPMLENHPVFTGSMPDGVAVGEVDFRKYGNIHLQRRVTKPDMEEVVVDGRTRILFSQWDVCTGFLGTNTWGIIGYAPSTAEKLGRNILLYSLNPVPTVTAPKAAAVILPK